jgi:hypothetical protein
MTTTPRLALPLLGAAQAQKHVTHNEALADLDALVHLAVLERNRTVPPTAPTEGDRYLLGTGASGAFATHDGQIAVFDAGAWRFFAPQPGWSAYVGAEDVVLFFDGAVWRDLTFYAGRVEQLARLGIGTAADAPNRLAVQSNAALFTALAVAGGGTGDFRVVLNKEAAANTLSQLYQRGFSGRAETGLVGDDDFRIKVSPDGAAWRDALRVDRATAEVALPFTPGGFRNLLINPDFTVNQRVYGGGALTLNADGLDRWKSGAAGTTLTRAADGTMTLSGTILQVIENPGLAGQTVTVSIENPSATLTVDVSGAGGTITAGSGRRALTVTVPGTATGHVTLSLAGTGVSFVRPMLSRGPMVPGYERLPNGVMLILCQRYYEKSYDQAVAPGTPGAVGARVTRTTISSQTTIEGLMTSFAVRKRAVPTVAWYSTTGVVGRVRDTSGNTDLVASGSAQTSEAQIGSALISGSPVVGSLIYAHWTADAEL